MVESTKERTIDAFFKPPPKKARISDTTNGEAEDGSKTHLEFEANHNLEKVFSNHPTYPFPIRHLSESTSTALRSLPSSIGRAINDQADLDLLYFEPYIPRYLEREVFQFLRGELPFYRVEYDITRGGVETHVRTPRYTTVFGLDSTSHFSKPDGEVTDSKTGLRIPSSTTTTTTNKNHHYSKYPPRPIPKCLDDLRTSTEAATGHAFNFCLVNYYASGADSIAYHSDDERFLGPEPAIASFSLGARRDFLLRRKPVTSSSSPSTASKFPAPSETRTTPIKLPLGSGDMLLMRGRTQANWQHAIPKRKGDGAGGSGGRINITFRRAVVGSGTENYYRYNVGSGPVYRWDAGAREMRLWGGKGAGGE